MNRLIRLFNRRRLFDAMFTDEEKTTIINALYRRMDNHDTDESDEKYQIKQICNRLAKEFNT